MNYQNSTLYFKLSKLSNFFYPKALKHLILNPENRFFFDFLTKKSEPKLFRLLADF